MKLSFEKFLNKQKQLGLSINEKTGGCYDEEFYAVVETSMTGLSPVIRCHDGKSIPILDGEVFLKSLRETETSFKIQFFVNA